MVLMDIASIFMGMRMPIYPIYLSSEVYRRSHKLADVFVKSLPNSMVNVGLTFGK